jgi:hypothetical protein
MTQEIKFVADLSGVTEVTLLGTADLDYWGDRLRPHGLTPHPRDGAAQILVSATKARFKGVPFREVSFSVLVTPGQVRHRLRDAACLLRAFSSNRFFAFWERMVFRTAYYAARCEITAHDPIAIKVVKGVWYGTIAILPWQRAETAAAIAGHRYFVAKLSGTTTRYSFDGARDTLLLGTDSGFPELSQLAASGFAGEQWIVRAPAKHARSKTFTS